MKLQSTNYALSIHEELIAILTQELQKSTPSTQSNITYLHFRDPEYSATKGGYHPVEIAIDSNGKITYITDFSYDNGGDMAELVTELDFDFHTGMVQQMGVYYPIEKAQELFEIWQQNFCHYYQSGVFQVTVSHG